MKKQYTFMTILMLTTLCLSFVSAGYQYKEEPNYNTRRTMYSFQQENQYTCSGNCTVSEHGENFRLEETNQHQFLRFFSVNSKEEYTFDSSGILLEAKYNLWSRLLNRGRLKLGE